jgi:hypothetical protein
MFLFQHPRDHLDAVELERERIERRNRLLRELRGATPPFDGAPTSRLAAAMARAPYTGPERRSVPCPEMKEAMIP